MCWDPLDLPGRLCPFAPAVPILHIVTFDRVTDPRPVIPMVVEFSSARKHNSDLGRQFGSDVERKGRRVIDEFGVRRLEPWPDTTMESNEDLILGRQTVNRIVLSGGQLSDSVLLDPFELEAPSNLQDGRPIVCRRAV